MSTITLIMGESGTGKSTSIRTLDPKETYVINVLDKPLPFKEFRRSYTRTIGEKLGNYASIDNADTIIKCLDHLNKDRKDINTIIIDDFQYIMANEFMRRARERGFDKFTEIGQNAWKIIHHASMMREELHIFILSHTENDAQGRAKCKTIGKMIDEKVTLEGMFTIVLHSVISDGKYKFITQNDGTHIAKSPMGMFADTSIDNDLSAIKQKINDYYFESLPTL